MMKTTSPYPTSGDSGRSGKSSDLASALRAAAAANQQAESTLRSEISALSPRLDAITSFANSARDGTRRLLTRWQPTSMCILLACFGLLLLQNMLLRQQTRNLDAMRSSLAGSSSSAGKNEQFVVKGADGRNFVVWQRSRIVNGRNGEPYVRVYHIQE